MRRSRAISRPSSASPLHSVVTFLLVIVFSVLLQASASSICAPRPIAEPLPQGSSRLRRFCSLIRAYRPQISSCINWPIIVSFIRTASSTSTSKIHPRTIPGPSLRFVTASNPLPIQHLPSVNLHSSLAPHLRNGLPPHYCCRQAHYSHLGYPNRCTSNYRSSDGREELLRCP